ncbi:MAG TPA: tRNA lysidine(34) synthetase TilS, partial [Pseudomonadales bacterium]|nr:tRNA lysidine(34) synthetase TilS [Pseudomonadales bacterium]
MPDRLNSLVFSLLEQLMNRQAQRSSPVRRLIVAYSGGLDSSVLLHLLHAFVNGLAESEKRPLLLALHVNHNLQVQSSLWAEHCTKQAEKYGLTVHVMNAVVKKNGGQSPEEAAREARYQLFEQFVKEGDVLCLAHHQDDQAETLLLRLLRGSGPLGLSAMREQSTLASAMLLRPLLAVSRDRLADYALKHHLSWIDDPSNQNLRFDRNYLRHEIVPRLKSRWPGVNKTLFRVTEINQATVTLLDEVAEQDFRSVGLGQALNIAALQAFSEHRLDNLLRYWLQKQGATLPSRHNLQRIRNELLRFQKGGEALVRWPGADVRA